MVGRISTATTRGATNHGANGAILIRTRRGRQGHSGQGRPGRFTAPSTASPLLWRLHEAHHSAREVDWIAGSQSHALEIVIHQTIEVAAIVLCGASADVMLYKGAISIVSDMRIHANVDLRLSWLSRILNGPELHRWHHAIDYAPPGKNYATKFAFWDYLFGTADRRPGKPAGYGLAALFPTGFLAQQTHAFRRGP